MIEFSDGARGCRGCRHRVVDELWDSGEFTEALQSGRREQHSRWRTALKAVARQLESQHNGAGVAK